MSLVFARRDCLQQAELDPLGRSSRPEKDTFAISPSGHFFIHYDITGSAAPDLTDNDGNGVPDYVDEVGLIADSAYHVLVYELGFDLDPFYGDGGYDIYYWYGDPNKAVPSELKADGTSKGKSVKKIYLGFIPLIFCQFKSLVLFIVTKFSFVSSFNFSERLLRRVQLLWHLPLLPTAIRRPSSQPSTGHSAPMFASLRRWSRGTIPTSSGRLRDSPKVRAGALAFTRST